MTRPFPVTPSQRELQGFIAGYLAANDGISPSMREIGAALGRSTGHVRSGVLCLVERGWLRRCGRPRAARALELVAFVPIPAAPDGAPLFHLVPRSLRKESA